MLPLLKFRRARVAATVAANLETRGKFAGVKNPVNGIAPGQSVMHRRERYSMMGRRTILRHASSLSLSLSSVAPFSRNEMHRHCQKEPTPQHQTMTLQCFGSLKSSSGNNDPIRRSLSFYNDPPSNFGSGGGNSQQTPTMVSPAYTVYGEEIAFTLKAIPPEYRVLPSGTVILDASKRGRLLFEWTPMAGHDDGTGKKRYRWNASTRFALTAEEAGCLMARIDRGDPSVEFSRRVSGDLSPTGQSVDKIFLAKTIGLESTTTSAEAEGSSGITKNDGISLLVDYVDPDNHRFGQIPHPLPAGGGGPGAFGNEGMRGPLEIRLMVGEYQVLRSIIDYSIPKLVGWSTMLDRNVEQAISKSIEGGGIQREGGGRYGGNSPHNYQGGGSY